MRIHGKAEGQGLRGRDVGREETPSGSFPYRGWWRRDLEEDPPGPETGRTSTRESVPVGVVDPDPGDGSVVRYGRFRRVVPVCRG